MKPEFDLIGFNRDVRDLENIPFAVCLLNLDGTYAYANPAYLDLVGVAEAGFGVLAGSPFDCGLADPTENEEMRRALVEALHRGEEYAGVARVRGGDTDSRKDEVFHRISARRLDEGRLLVLTRPVLSEHDILLAERDQEIERLARWRSEFLQNSPSLVIVHDLDGIISFANAAAEEALGEGPGELVGRDLGAFVTPAHLARYLEYLEQLERRPSTRGLLEVRGAYGTTRSWRYQSSVSIDGEDPPAATAQIVDVTNEVQLLQALQESELRLHRLVAADPRPIWITDQTGLRVFANDAA
ncbi:MAG TPA: PAS domain S-box protein, partial [Dehalococcoidia bacterium]|nr:PAS domain S-box protein [Dehalococcoidia bacterium]